tara:strand:+ start:3206 stop:4054 length:849 start_codon:yes stop_codon:yes gene_type:complete
MINIFMKKSTEYLELIENAKKSKPDPCQVYEVHHIIPRCMGGTDDKDNLVHLTPEQHFKAHYYLAVDNPTNGKLAQAWNAMLAGRDFSGVHIDAKIYEDLRYRAAYEKATYLISTPSGEMLVGTAALLYNVHCSTIYNRCASGIRKWKDWFLINKETKQPLKPKIVEPKSTSRTNFLYTIADAENLTLQEAIEKFNINKHTLMFRCKSSNPRFKNWVAHDANTGEQVSKRPTKRSAKSWKYYAPGFPNGAGATEIAKHYGIDRGTVMRYAAAEINGYRRIAY